MGPRFQEQLPARVAALGLHRAAGWDAGPCGPELGVGCSTEVILGLLPAKKYKKVTGRGDLLGRWRARPCWRRKFPQDYFPRSRSLPGAASFSAGPGPVVCATALPRQDVSPQSRCRARRLAPAGGPDPVGLAGWPRVEGWRDHGWLTSKVNLPAHRHSQARRPSPAGCRTVLGAPSKPHSGVSVNAPDREHWDVGAGPPGALRPHVLSSPRASQEGPGVPAPQAPEAWGRCG